ncbi:hypothetical protein ANTRET_LOCUS23 [Anthophora retusa]
MLAGLQKGILERMEQHRQEDEARRQVELAQRQERQAAERAAREARDVAYDLRMAELEKRVQVLAVSFLNRGGGKGVVQGAADVRGSNSFCSAAAPDPLFVPATSALLGPCSHATAAQVGFGASNLGYAVKPAFYDGKSSWEEYFIQFEAIACANGWDDARKATALIAVLEGSARGVLTSLSASQRESFRELVSALEFRFGARNLSNLNYVLFQNCRQRRGESISSLAAEIERLARAAFADCPVEARDKLAASQFVTALASEEMKRALRLGGFVSLRAAVTRALEMEAVEAMAEREISRDAAARVKPVVFVEEPPEKKRRVEKTCWTCGKSGHFQRDCGRITAKGKTQGNGRTQF